MRGNRYNTVDSNFDGAVPPNTGGNPNLAEQAKQRMEEQKKKSEELRGNEKARAVEFAKKRALVNINSPKNEAPESKSPNKEKPDEDNIQAEEKPEGKKIVWNPNSRYAGMGRVIQHVKPLKKVSDTILNMGNKYSEEVEYEEDTFGFMSMVSKAGSKVGSMASKAGTSAMKKASIASTIISKSISKVIKNPTIPTTNATGIVTDQATRNANKLANKGLSSNVGSTIKGVLNSKVKSATVGAVVSGSVAAANGKNPVGAAMGGALAGGTISHLANKTYSFLDNMPSIIDSEKELLRAKLIANGYSKELSIIDKTEARERKEDRLYLNAKKIVKDFLSGQRTNRVNLKGNRGMLLKKLSNPKEDKLYSSLSLLYFHCENSQI